MPINKIDSNVTGLRYAEEASIKTLPGSPVFYPLEPNGYNNFGGQVTTVARNPINPIRSRLKGVLTDLDASGGFGQDLGQSNLTRLLQGFFFADIREKASTLPWNGTQVPLTGVVSSTDTISAASGLDAFKANELILASGFGQAGNNGLKSVSSATATSLVTNETLVDETTPPTDAKLQTVGYEFAAGEASVDVSASYPRIVLSTTDPSTLGLIVGEWVYIGGDKASSQFTNAANNGFARLRSITSTYLEFDKTSSTMVTEAGTSVTLRLFFGNVLKNEDTPSLIKTRSYQLERTLGQDTNGTMSEYLTGAVASELTLNIKQADKITVDLTFVASDHEQYDGTTGVKSGTRPALDSATAFNTSSDFTRLKMHQITAGDSNPTALFAFMTDMTLSIKNNITPNKAVSVLGAFDVSVGQFEVSGNVTAYFADVAAIQAVRNNADIALDAALVKNNAGLVWDVPLITLGDGRLKVEQDKPITLPLSVDAAKSTAGHTLLLNEFPYLPTAAE